jgi:hypothetical protein
VMFNWYPTCSVQYTIPRTSPGRSFIGHLMTGISWLVIGR